MKTIASSRAWIAAALLASPALCDVSFSAAGIKMSLSNTGKVSSLVDTVTGVDRTPQQEGNQPHLVTVRYIGQGPDTPNIKPTNFTATGNVLTYTFGSLTPAPVVTVRVDSFAAHLAVRITNVVNGGNLALVQFVELSPTSPLFLQNFAGRFIRFDDSGVERHMVIYPLDEFVETIAGYSPLWGSLKARAQPQLMDYPAPATFAGRSAALFTAGGSQQDLFTAIQAVENQHALPAGIAAKQQPALQRSCFFWFAFSPEDRDLALQYSQEAGVGRILMNVFLWADIRNQYAPAGSWGSLEGLQTWIAQAQASGIKVGAHVFPTAIAKDSVPYIQNGADPRLYRDLTLTLKSALPASQEDGLIETTSPPIGWPTAWEHRELVIGDEIIVYTGIQTTSPFGLLGPFERAKHQAIGPQHHAAGTTVGHLDGRYSGFGSAYLWDISSGGMHQWSADIAAAVNAAGFDYVYCDGIEWNHAPVGVTAPQAGRMVYDFMSPKPLWMESAATGPFGWNIWGTNGQVDYYLDAIPFKSEVDKNVQNVQLAQIVNKYMPVQLGWAPFASPDDQIFVGVDDVEYLLARSLALRAPVVFYPNMHPSYTKTMKTLPHRAVILNMIKTYEALRLSEYFSPEETAFSLTSGQEAMLFRGDAGRYYFSPVSALAPITRTNADLLCYVSELPISGRPMGTCWLRSAAPGRFLRFSGVAAGDLFVHDYLGNAVPVIPVGESEALVPLETRIYISTLASNLADLLQHAQVQ